MNDNAAACIGGVIIGIVVTFWVTKVSNDLGWRQDAVKVGVGRFHPTTGQFEWISTKEINNK